MVTSNNDCSRFQAKLRTWKKIQFFEFVSIGDTNQLKSGRNGIPIIQHSVWKAYVMRQFPVGLLMHNCGSFSKPYPLFKFVDFKCFKWVSDPGNVKDPATCPCSRSVSRVSRVGLGIAESLVTSTFQYGGLFKRQKLANFVASYVRRTCCLCRRAREEERKETFQKEKSGYKKGKGY